MVAGRCGSCGESAHLINGAAVIVHDPSCDELKKPPTSFSSPPPNVSGVSVEAEEARRRLQEFLFAPVRSTLPELVESVIRRLRGYAKECCEVELVLGVALGYGVGEEGGPCPGSPIIGDHTPVTLAMEAARKLSVISE